MSIRGTLSFSGLLARRFLVSRESDGFLSLISAVSVVGIALGVAALTTVTSVMNGFEGELSRVITGVNGDAILYSRGEPIREPALAEDKIRRALGDRVVAVTPSMVVELMASGLGGVSGAVLEGLDVGTIGLVTEIPKKITQGRMPQAEGEVVLGSVVAEKLGLAVGGSVRLIIPFATGGDDGSSAKAVDAKVVGISRMGMHDYDSKFIFATLPFAQTIAGIPGAATHFKLKLAPGADPQAAADQLGEYFSFPFRARSWAQLNRNLFYAVKLEKAVISIILLAIILVAAFNVVSTLMMMIHDKTKEIAILKSMGASSGAVGRVFAVVGMTIGVVGTALGLGLGVLLCKVVAKYGYPLDPKVYLIDRLPVRIDPVEFGLTALITLAVCGFATLVPSRRASALKPVEGLRYE